ncbi:unnamed protein product [Sphagnum tenellum]
MDHSDGQEHVVGGQPSSRDTVVVTIKVASTEEPKWTTVMAKNMRQVVDRAMETLVDTPKQEECKLNLRLIGFEAKEGEIEKEFV